MADWPAHYTLASLVTRVLACLAPKGSAHVRSSLCLNNPNAACILSPSLMTLCW